MACLASSVAFCRSLSIDLRKPAPKGVVRAMAQRHVASAAVEDSGFIRKVNLDAGVADVGTVAVGDELALTLFEDVSVTLTLKQQMPSPMGGDAAANSSSMKNRTWSSSSCSSGNTMQNSTSWKCTEATSF